MRTPGRCSNIEGCWISASHRDVWLNVGEDFTCPNCGGMLSAPPGRAVHARGVRKAAFTATAAVMGIAAVAVATVKLSALSLSAQPALTAMLRAPSDLLAATFHSQPPLLVMLQPRPAPERQQAPMPMMRTQAAPLLAETQVSSSTPDKPAATLIYTASKSEPAPPPAPQNFAPGKLVVGKPAHQLPTTEIAANPAPAAQIAAAEPPLPAPTITVVSAKAFVLPPMAKQRPVVLPISFGRPVAPETDAQPARREWRFHGIRHYRHTVFLPGPGPAPSPTPGEDAISQIRTSADLR